MSTGQRWLAILQNAFQEPVRHQHASGHYINTVMRFFAAMALKIFLLLGAVAVIARSLTPGVARVQHQHGNVPLDGGQERGRMEHLGPKIGQLGGLFKADGLDAPRIRTKVGSVVIIPSTSVHISMRSALKPAPTMAALKSDPPRPSVVLMPSCVAAINPPITGTRLRSSSGFTFSTSRAWVSSKRERPCQKQSR